MTWHPIIPSGYKSELFCLDILQGVREYCADVADNSLFGGNCGVNIFTFCIGSYLAKASVKQLAFTDAIKIIHSSDNIETYTFCNGLSGCSWAIDFLKKQKWVDCDNPFKYYNTELYKISISELKQNNYDYLHGSLGICLNALENLDEDAEKYLYEVVELLTKNADKKYAGITWKSIVFESEAPIYNLGLSHGIPGIIAVISYIYKAGIAKERCLELLNGSISWLLQQKLSAGSLSIFPCYVQDDIPKNYQLPSSRLAWCYGDLGIARSLWLAGKAIGNEQWKQEAVNIMLHASKRRDLEENSVWDAGLCHGSAGIAHIFNRFYQDTRLEAFKVAAIYWYKVTLDFAKFEDGINGYKMYIPPKNENEIGHWKNSADLLEGAAGIGLALLVAISNEEPTWDRCLFLS